MEFVISEKTKRRAEKRNVLVYPAEGKSKYKIEVYDDHGLFLSFAGVKGEKRHTRVEFEAKFAKEIKVRKSRRWWQSKLFF